VITIKFIKNLLDRNNRMNMFSNINKIEKFTCKRHVLSRFQNRYIICKRCGIVFGMYCPRFDKIFKWRCSIEIIVKVQITNTHFVQIITFIHAMSSSEHMPLRNKNTATKPSWNIWIFLIPVSQSGNPRPSACKVNQLLRINVIIV